MVDEEQINSMSYVLFEDILEELGQKLMYDAAVNYAGNSFCDKSWEIIMDFYPMNDKKHGTHRGGAHGGLSGLAKFVQQSNVKVMGKGTTLPGSLGKIQKGKREVLVGEETLTVRNHIPLEEKIKMVNELAGYVLMVDDENEVILENHTERVGTVYFVMKYYTDADLTDAEPADVYDWVVNNDAWDKISDWVGNDLFEVHEMQFAMQKNIEKAYEKEHSLGTAFRKSFGFLFNREDLAETLARTQEVSDQMLEVVGRLNEAGRKPDGGRVNVGGNIISIGKKK